MKKTLRKKISLPHFGRYTHLFKRSLERLGAQVVLPPRITERTVKIGTKHSSEMMCFPYKVTLGNFIEVLERHPDIDQLIMFDSMGSCRFRHYHILQEQTLQRLGYEIRMLPFSAKSLVSFHREVGPGNNLLKAFREYRRLYRKIKRLSRRAEVEPHMPNVAIIGEIYTCIEPSVNFGIEDELRDAGVNVINTVDLYSFIKDSIKGHFLRDRFRDKYYHMAMKYLNGPLGGHGAENIENLLRYIDKGVDGVIWLRPLSCMPESTVDLVIKGICRRSGVPVLVFDIDESNFALNIATRLETFIEQIKGIHHEEQRVLHRV